MKKWFTTFMIIFTGFGVAACGCGTIYRAIQNDAYASILNLGLSVPSMMHLAFWIERRAELK